jgi:hypothetical protein
MMPPAEPNMSITPGKGPSPVQATDKMMKMQKRALLIYVKINK